MYFDVKGSLKFNCFLVFLAYNILPSVHSPPDPHQKFVLGRFAGWVFVPGTYKNLSLTAFLPRTTIGAKQILVKYSKVRKLGSRERFMQVSRMPS
jgi:hypothetical protein